MTDEHYRVKAILRRQFRATVMEMARAREDRYHDLAAMCESPIERLLLAPLMFIMPRCLFPAYGGPADPPGEARLFVQFPIAGYRLDFAYIVTPFKEAPIRLAIECDGQAFHAEQADRERDAARQNDLRGHGFETLRFTGSQIHADPEECAQQVSDTVDRIHAQRIHDACDVARREQAR